MSRNLEQRIKKLEQNRSHQVHLELPLFTVLSEDKKALLLDAGTLALLGVKQPELQPEPEHQHQSQQRQQRPGFRQRQPQ